MRGGHQKRANSHPIPPSRTTYAVLAYGLDHRAIVCNAATLGRALYLLDPSRSRTAIVGENVSSEVRHHLTNGHWNLHEACCLNRMNRKAELWRLAFKRVWYWDADTLPLNMPISALQDAWSMHLGVHRVAATHESAECFNSGTLLLEPNMTIASLIDDAAKDAQVGTARGRWHRCKSGFDHLALNDVFRGPTEGSIGFHRLKIPIEAALSHTIPYRPRMSLYTPICRPTPSYVPPPKANPYSGACIPSGSTQSPPTVTTEGAITLNPPLSVPPDPAAFRHRATGTARSL